MMEFLDEDSIPSLVQARPLILLTGFLGAGKTTLLRDLLRATRDAQLESDVILNDYGDASLDSSTLEGLAANIEPLTATCACCEGLDFLLDLSLRSSQSSSDLLFVELNGTADPVPIVEAFALMEHKMKRHPRWQVCIINPHLFGQRKRYSDIEKLQLQTASHVYFSHSENTGIPEEVISQIRSINASVTFIEKHDLEQAVIELGQRHNKRLMHATSNKEELRRFEYLKSDHHRRTHEFNSCMILMPEVVTREQVKEWLTQLPDEVIRAKVIVGIKGSPDRYLFERVEAEVSPYIQRVSLGSNVKNSAILIGPNLNPESLARNARQHFKIE